MRVLVLQPPTRDHHASLGQRLDHRIVGIALVAILLQDALAGEAWCGIRHHAVRIDRERDGRIDAALPQHLLRVHPDDVVVSTVAGCGMHEARAGIVGDVIAIEQRHVEVVAERGKRMRANDPFKIVRRDGSDLLEFLDLARLHHVCCEFIRQNIHIADGRPVSFRRGFDFIQAVFDI